MGGGEGQETQYLASLNTSVSPSHTALHWADVGCNAGAAAVRDAGWQKERINIQ